LRRIPVGAMALRTDLRFIGSAHRNPLVRASFAPTAHDRNWNSSHSVATPSTIHDARIRHSRYVIPNETQIARDAARARLVGSSPSSRPLSSPLVSPAPTEQPHSRPLNQRLSLPRPCGAWRRLASSRRPAVPESY